MRYSIVRQRNGIAAAAGGTLAILGWATLAGAGAAVILERYPVIKTIIAVLGGLYLIYLGASGFLRSRAVAKAENAMARTATRPGVQKVHHNARQAFTAGVVSAALNPKLGLLFLAMMPTFIPENGNTLLWGIGLGAVFAAVGFSYISILSTVASKAMNWFKKPSITLRLEWVSCATLAIMGLGVLISAFV